MSFCAIIWVIWVYDHVLFLPEGILISLKRTYWLTNGSYLRSESFFSVFLHISFYTQSVCSPHKSNQSLLSSKVWKELASFLPLLYLFNYLHEQQLLNIILIWYTKHLGSPPSLVKIDSGLQTIRETIPSMAIPLILMLMWSLSWGKSLQDKSRVNVNWFSWGKIS